MSERSTNEPSASTSSAVDSPARISATPAPAPDSRALGLASGSSTSGSFAHFDRASSLWKTYQLCLLGGSESFSEAWPRAGTTRSGIAFPLRPSAPLTAVIGSSWSRGEYPTPSATPYGSSQNEGQIPHDRPTRGTPSLTTWAAQWPTPTASMETPADLEQARYAGDDPRRPSYAEAAAKWPTPTARRSDRSPLLPGAATGLPLPTTCTHGGDCRWRLSPRFVESLMGFPPGWTDVD